MANFTAVCQNGLSSTNFICEKVNDNLYNFTFNTTFHLGNLVPPPVYETSVIVVGDTLDVELIYDVRGVFSPFLGSYSSTTISYGSIPSNVAHIKLSVGAISGLIPKTYINDDIFVHYCDDLLLSTENFEDFKNGLAIYPNPTSDYFTVSDKVTFSRINIYNNLGQIVKRFEKSKDGNYDVSDLSGGIYYLNYLEENRKVGQVKMVKR